jgi:pilus assembly protein FimV
MAPTARYLLGRLRVGISGFLGIVTAVASINAAALGLGEIELDSALNEQLDARIELMDVGGLAPSEIIISLASSEDFDRVGVERFFYLTDLEFEVTFERDSAVVVVSSSRPVTEPYLNFIVEVLWPNGRMLKEFTLLLDPPTFSQAAAPAVAAPVESTRNTASSGRVQRQQPARPATQVQVTPSRAAEPSPLDQDVVGDEYRMTDRNDTLWGIASRTRPSSSVSVQQNMLAIQRLNPDAFIDGNINLLKAGYTLRLPDEATATSLSQNDAVAAVASQNEAWRSGVSVAAAPAAATPPAVDETSARRSPVDATASSAAPETAATGDGELRIVAGQGDSATGLATEAASEDVAAVLEENDRLAREVEELTYQLESGEELVANQLAVKDRQLEVRDQQIAELQQRLAELDAQAQTAAATPAAQTQNQSTTQPNWWENPLILYGGAGVLVLALAGWMLTARRRRESEEDFFEPTAPSMSAHAEDMDHEEASSSSYLHDEDDEDEDAGLDVRADDEHAPADALPGSETSDVIGEADIYIAYGRYPQAIGLLLGVLEDDAERNDVRLKLLELFSETNDRDAFNEHLALLVEHCDDEDALMTARELETKFGEKSISLDDVISEDTDASQSNIDDEDDDVLAEELADLTTSDGDSSELSIEPIEDETAELDITSAVEDEEVGFELELDEPETTDDVADTGASNDLGGDLGIDFDPGEADEPEPETAATRATREDADEDLMDLAEMGIGSDADSGASSEVELKNQTPESYAATQLDSDVAVAEEDDFDFQDEGDSANTKLDLARAYIDMGDADGARDILKEVMDEGNSEQKQRAQGMLDSL